MKHLRLGVLYCAMFLLPLAANCAWSADQPSAHSVSQEEALRIAERFAAPSQIAGIRFAGKQVSQTFPPYTALYVFEIPLGVQSLPRTETIPDPDNPDIEHEKVIPSKPLFATVAVEEASGRVIGYFPGFNGYPRQIKHRNEKKLEETDLIAPAKAEELSREVLRKAGLSLEQWRVRSIMLNPPHRQENYYEYTVNWDRYASYPDIGEVQLSDTAMVSIDALNGDLDDYLFKEYGAPAAIAKSTITKERAIEVARANYGAKCGSDIIEPEAHLKWFVNAHPSSDNAKEFALWQEDRKRFHKEVAEKRAELVWRVTFAPKGIPQSIADARPPDPSRIRSVDVSARTGDVVNVW